MNGFSPNRRNHLTFVILLKLYFVYLSEGHFSFLRDPFALKPEKIERGRKETLDKLIPRMDSIETFLFGLQKACHICLSAEKCQAQLALLPSTSYS
ncbi:hypothetical protein P5673_013406 [Acropora cervicornis]|uniref:Uncharacterized protein n=1 Tax=Acropora cervicornis TaxID=6130 RepID=A0AAD9V6Q2_ACRCE|nr:hypothetical protein P5673_013406 [Acropora cervicornis]